jgi:hypothetical protein
MAFPNQIRQQHESDLLAWVEAGLQLFEPEIKVIWSHQQGKVSAPMATLQILSDIRRPGMPYKVTKDVEVPPGKYQHNVITHKLGTMHVDIRATNAMDLASELDDYMFSPPSELFFGQDDRTVVVLHSIAGPTDVKLERGIGYEPRATIDFEFAYARVRVTPVDIIETVNVDVNVVQ